MSVANAAARVLSGLICIGVLAAISVAVFGQDAVDAAGEFYDVVLENDQVRVLRATYPPGGKSAMHEHPGSVVVHMTGGALRLTDPDGQTFEQVLPAGRVVWSGGSHEIENIGGDELVVVIVEVKDTSSVLERMLRR